MLPIKLLPRPPPLAAFPLVQAERNGFGYGGAKKDVYFDGHEREDVVKYREEVFLKAWKEHSRRFVIFKEDGSWEKPPGLRKAPRTGHPRRVDFQCE
jgi:hypothetical protein